MRAKRAKQYRKLMNAYALSFGFRSPLQILLDADFIRDAARYKMNLGSMLEGTFSGYQIKPMITQCCIRHLYNAPATTDAEKREKDTWIEVAKQAERRRCGHHELEEPLSALECLDSVVDAKENNTNKHRYVIATQDPDIRAHMRGIVGVPLVYINRSVMILERLSTATEQMQRAEERSKVRAGLKGPRANAAQTKRKRDDTDEVGSSDGNEESVTPKRRKTRGPKGPNPLSMKKAKTTKYQEHGAGVSENGPRAAVRSKSTGQKLSTNAGLLGETDIGMKNGGDDGASSSEVKKRKRKRKPKDPEPGGPDIGELPEV